MLGITTATRDFDGAVIKSNGISTAILRTGKFVLDILVLTCATKIRHFRRGTRMLREIALSSSLELLHVGDTRCRTGIVTVTYEVRDRNSCQNGDDGDHDHDFYEGKTLLHFEFHGCVPLFNAIDTMPIAK